MTLTLDRSGGRRAATSAASPPPHTPPPVPPGPVAGAAAAGGSGVPASAARRLRHDFAATRVAFTWFGTRKALTPDQKAEAAERFGAETRYLSAAKRLLDNKHEAFRQVTAIRSQVVSFWKGMSLPYPEPGVRLIRLADVERFNGRMTTFKAELAEAVVNLDGQFEQLKAAARDRLGRLYDPADYPPTLVGLFAVDFDFPAVEPPEYLLRLSPHLYEQERERIGRRFDEAVRLAEEAFTAEFAKLVSHLTERLTDAPGGERKVFRDSAVTNLSEFFARFRALNVRSSADLERLVETARQALRGVDPERVRQSASLRGQITGQLSAVQQQLDRMLVDAPRRRILRARPAAGGSGPAGAAAAAEGTT